MRKTKHWNVATLLQLAFLFLLTLISKVKAHTNTTKNTPLITSTGLINSSTDYILANTFDENIVVRENTLPFFTPEMISPRIISNDSHIKSIIERAIAHLQGPSVPEFYRKRLILALNQGLTFMPLTHTEFKNLLTEKAAAGFLNPGQRPIITLGSYHSFESVVRNLLHELIGHAADFAIQQQLNQTTLAFSMDCHKPEDKKKVGKWAMNLIREIERITKLLKESPNSEEMRTLTEMFSSESAQNLFIGQFEQIIQAGEKKPNLDPKNSFIHGTQIRTTLINTYTHPGSKTHSFEYRGSKPLETTLFLANKVLNDVLKHYSERKHTFEIVANALTTLPYEFLKQYAPELMAYLENLTNQASLSLIRPLDTTKISREEIISKEQLAYIQNPPAALHADDVNQYQDTLNFIRNEITIDNKNLTREELDQRRKFTKALISHSKKYNIDYPSSITPTAVLMLIAVEEGSFSEALALGTAHQNELKRTRQNMGFDTLIAFYHANKKQNTASTKDLFKLITSTLNKPEFPKADKRLVENYLNRLSGAETSKKPTKRP